MAGQIAGQEQEHVGHFLRFAHPAQGNGGGNALHQLRRQGGHHVRTGDTGGYGVDPEVQIPTILGKSGLPVFLLGKVADVVTNNYGTSIPMVDTASVLQRTLEIVKEQETAFICTNVQETDLCGHRENVAAYADRLRVADEWIGKIRDALGEDDILIVQADHGNDPTIGHPHHTREMVPLMIHSAHSTPKNIGIRKTLSDVGATAADYFHSKAPENGTSFLPLLLK